MKARCPGREENISLVGRQQGWNVGLGQTFVRQQKRAQRRGSEDKLYAVCSPEQTLELSRGLFFDGGQPPCGQRSRFGVRVRKFERASAEVQCLGFEKPTNAQPTDAEVSCHRLLGDGRNNKWRGDVGIRGTTDDQAKATLAPNLEGHRLGHEQNPDALPERPEARQRFQLRRGRRIGCPSACFVSPIHGESCVSLAHSIFVKTVVFFLKRIG